MCSWLCEQFNSIVLLRAVFGSPWPYLTVWRLNRPTCAVLDTLICAFKVWALALWTISLAFFNIFNSFIFYLNTMITRLLLLQSPPTHSKCCSWLIYSHIMYKNLHQCLFSTINGNSFPLTFSDVLFLPPKLLCLFLGQTVYFILSSFLTVMFALLLMKRWVPCI